MHINRLIERFLREHELSPTRFGRLAASDPQLVFDMRRGREFGTDMERRLRKFVLLYRGSDTSTERSAA